MSILEHKTPKASLSFPQEARITRGAELHRIALEGRRIRTTNIEVRAAAFPLMYSGKQWGGLRVGFVVPRYKHSAVARNKLRRRLRELARLHLVPADLRVDIVLRVRPETYGATFSELAADINQVLSELRQWRVAITDLPNQEGNSGWTE